MQSTSSLSTGVARLHAKPARRHMAPLGTSARCHSARAPGSAQPALVDDEPRREQALGLRDAAPAPSTRRTRSIVLGVVLAYDGCEGVGCT